MIKILILQFCFFQFAIAQFNNGPSGLDPYECRGHIFDKEGNKYCYGHMTGDDVEPNGNTGAFSSADAFVAKFNPQGQRVWATKLGEISARRLGVDASQSDDCNALTIDSSGNLYCVGETDGHLGEKNSGYSTNERLSYRSKDLFVMKVSPQGEIVWVSQLGLTTSSRLGLNSKAIDSCESVATDSEGNVYCGGMTFGDMVSTDRNTSSDAIVVKMNKDGKIQWVKQLNKTTASPFGGTTNGSDHCSEIFVDNNDNIHCTGSSVFFMSPWAPMVTGAENNGAKDLFSWSLNSDGKSIRISQGFNLDKTLGSGRNIFENIHQTFPGAQYIDKDGNKYICGSVSTSLSRQWDLFIVKLNAKGETIWAREFAENPRTKHAGSSSCRSLLVTNGHVYLGGHTSTNLYEKLAGKVDPILVKLTKDGGVVFKKHFGKVTLAAHSLSLFSSSVVSGLKEEANGDISCRIGTFGSYDTIGFAEEATRTIKIDKYGNIKKN